MSRALLSELVTLTISGAIVPTGTQVTVQEVNGSPLAQTMYDAAAGGTPVPNPLTTSGTGRVTAYVTTAQRCLLKVGTNAAVPATFAADPADVPTLAPATTQTFTNTLLENLSEALTDDWTASTGAAHSFIGYARGTAGAPAVTRGIPAVFISSKIQSNQDQDRQSPSDVYIQSERWGSTTVAGRTISGGSGASTATTLRDDGVNLTPGALVGQQVTTYTTVGANDVPSEYRYITGNTDHVITVSKAWAATPTAGVTKYTVGTGMAPQTVGLLVNLLQNSTSKPVPSYQGQESIGIMSYARRSDASSNAGVYALLGLAQNTNALGHAIGAELDLVNAGGPAPAYFGTEPNRGIILNLLSTVSGAGVNNTVGVLVQSSGATAALFRGMDFGANSLSSYVANADQNLVQGIGIDFAKLAGASTSPALLRAGSGHVLWLGRVAGNTADVKLQKWLSDVLHFSAGQIDFNDAAEANRFRIDGTGLSVPQALLAQRFKANFSHGTASNRLLFQGNADASALVGVLPGGASSNVAGWVAFGGSDPDNAAIAQLYVSGGETPVSYVEASKSGTGVLGPLRLRTNATDQVQVTTAGILDWLNGQVVAAAGGSAGLNNKTGDGATTGPTSLTGTKWLKIAIAGTVGFIPVMQ